MPIIDTGTTNWLSVKCPYAFDTSSLLVNSKKYDKNTFKIENRWWDLIQMPYRNHQSWLRFGPTWRRAVCKSRRRRAKISSYLYWPPWPANKTKIAPRWREGERASLPCLNKPVRQKLPPRTISSWPSLLVRQNPWENNNLLPRLLRGWVERIRILEIKSHRPFNSNLNANKQQPYRHFQSVQFHSFRDLEAISSRDSSHLDQLGKSW